MGAYSRASRNVGRGQHTMRSTDTESPEQTTSGVTGRDSHEDGGWKGYWQPGVQVLCRTRGLYTFRVEREKKT